MQVWHLVNNEIGAHLHDGVNDIDHSGAHARLMLPASLEQGPHLISEQGCRVISALRSHSLVDINDDSSCLLRVLEGYHSREDLRERDGETRDFVRVGSISPAAWSSPKHTRPPVDRIVRR